MCSLFDIMQCIKDLLPWWLPYAWWGFVGLMVVSFLVKLKTAFGWPAMLALWTIVAIGGGVYIDRKVITPKVVTAIVKTVPKHEVVPHDFWNDLPPASLTRN